MPHRWYGNKITQFQVLILHKISFKTITQTTLVFPSSVYWRTSYVHELLALLSQAYIDPRSVGAWLTASCLHQIPSSDSLSAY